MKKTHSQLTSEKARIVTEMVKVTMQISMMIMTDGLIPMKSEKVQTHFHQATNL